jgi:L-lactate dehydrogenase
MLHGEYGLEDVCLSILTLVGENGIKATVPAKLTEEELAKLHRSAACLKSVIVQIKF